MTGDRKKRGNRGEMRKTEGGVCVCVCVCVCLWGGELRGVSSDRLAVILRGVWGCQRPCNPPPTPALLLPLSSPPPHHDKPDLLSIKEPQATSPIFPPFLTQRSSSHLSFTLPRSWSARRDRLSLARLGRRAHSAWQGGATSSPSGSV